MNRTRTTILCRAALAIAAILAGSLAWGEVTIVGSSWQERQLAQQNNLDLLRHPSPPSTEVLVQPKALAESEQGDSSGEFPWLDNWLAWRPCWHWFIDYRFRALCASGISSEYGTQQPPPDGYAPLSRLNFPLNSCWHGLRLGVDEPTWSAHFEWMAPQQGIQGQFSDYDWRSAGSDENFSDLGFADQRFVDGQMIDLGLDFKLTDCTFKLPVEIWPTLGFRWERFNIGCYDGVQVKYRDEWLNPPDSLPGDVLSFNQQFYTGYLGGQFRTRVKTVLLTFQADWGYTWGYNIDHHLLRDGDRFTMEATQGNSWHLGFTAEAPVTEHFSFGFQFDHLEIRTTGTHHLQNLPLGEDATWDNGVSVSSNQTSLMAFLRFRL
jgi:hypothetical protein